MQLESTEHNALIGLIKLNVYVAPKIQRRRFTVKEQRYLETVYRKNKYPTKYEYDIIIEAVNSNYNTVYAWFSRRRFKN
jgi:hypothetical protein